MTKDELVEKCAEAVYGVDMNFGLEAWPVAVAQTVISEVCRALQNPTNEMHQAFMDGYHRELAKDRLQITPENMLVCFTAAWVSALGASPLEMEVGQ